jgi:hypothetical protein
MAIIKSAIKLIIREYANYNFQAPVLTLGVPEIYATASELEEWFKDATGKKSTIQSSNIENSSNKIGGQLGWVNAKTFFNLFDWSDVTSIDVPGSEYQPDMIHDLNQNIPLDLINKFNLVIDPGTIEHVFDVKTCLSNIINSLKIGGVVVHLVPIYSYNGGYYSINPNVLNDFYCSNGFSDIKSYIIMWDRYKAFTDKRSLCYEYSEEIMGSRHALTQGDQYRYKEKEVEEVKSPLQFSEEYGKQSPENTQNTEEINSSNKATLLKILSVLYKIFPFSTVFYLQSIVYRQLLSRKIRRSSFWI